MALTSAQCRAARALLRMSQEELRLAARVAKKTIADLELDQREPYERTLDAIQAALEAAGVVFIDEREASDDGGEGVRLKLKSRKRGSRKRVRDSPAAPQPSRRTSHWRQPRRENGEFV